jgi:hypothetical protein
MVTGLDVELSEWIRIYKVKRRTVYCYEDSLYYKSPFIFFRASILDEKSLIVAYICSYDSHFNAWIIKDIRRFFTRTFLLILIFLCCFLELYVFFLGSCFILEHLFRFTNDWSHRLIFFPINFYVIFLDLSFFLYANLLDFPFRAKISS